MMYPFSNICNYNPITYSGQGIPHRPFLNDDTCFITKLEDSSSLFHLLSPYMHYEDEAVILQDLHNLELQQQPLTTENTIADTATNMGESGKKNVSNEPKEGCSKECNSTAKQIARKKSSKKDRHSKINTAHGPRDRRMRLSLDVARKFFDLQDVLGFDKASKTVEWLLTKSRSAIKELSRSSCVVGAYSASSTSECEVISGLNQSANNQQACANRKGKPSGTKEKKKIKAARRIPFHPLAKKSREKARERARERTKEKIRRLSESKLQIGAVGHALNRLGSSSSVETGEESGSQGHVNKPSYEMLAEEEELSPHERQLAGTEENISNDSLVVTDNWSPSTIFNFQQNAGASNGHQFEEFQFYGKSWESYSNMKL